MTDIKLQSNNQVWLQWLTVLSVMVTPVFMAACGGDDDFTPPAPAPEPPPVSLGESCNVAKFQSAFAADKIVDASVTAAVVVPTAGTIPEHCKVNVLATPTPQSSIQIEVRLPLSGWNGKLNGQGTGGYSGAIPNLAIDALRRGYIVAGNDSGHTGASNPSSTEVWGLEPEKVVDWASRATHLTAVHAKSFAKGFYGSAPKYSYFTGCSGGGQEALMEAQRYPEDYDGVVAGAAANYWTRQSAAWHWQASWLQANPLSVAQMKAINAAVVQQCDAADGLTDGIVDDPRNCHFDPSTLVPAVLTAAQAEAVKKVYAGPTNPRTGEQLYPGLQPGSEYGAAGDDALSQLIGSWMPFHVDNKPYLADFFYRQMVFGDLNWDWRNFSYDTDVTLGDVKMGPVVNAVNSDLSPLFGRGGKLIIYHGWNDPNINPENSINYYKSVALKLGSTNPLAVIESSARLFMVPGMTHCTGGTGPNSFDLLAAIDRWVDLGQAPDRVIASGGSVAGRTRPLCPYPKVARYLGSGSIDDAANFACIVP